MKEQSADYPDEIEKEKALEQYKAESIALGKHFIGQAQIPRIKEHV